MRVLRDLIGKPVIDSSARNIGDVVDVEIDEESGQVSAILVGHSKRPGVLRRVKWLGGREKLIRIPYSRIIAIEDAVLVEGEWDREKSAEEES